MEDKLSELHAQLCEELLTRLKEGEQDDEGHRVPAKASTLNVIRQFLKDNNVTSTAADDSPLGRLVGELPPEFRVGSQAKN